MTILKLSWCVFITICAISLYIVFNTPSDTQLPIHWNLAGEIDRHADAMHLMIGLPALLLTLLLIFVLMRRVDPRKQNVDMSHKAIDAIGFALSLFILAIQAGYVAILSGTHISIWLIIVCGAGLLLMVIGNYATKTRSNYFIGIRTPWTLASEHIWKKTHQLAGALLMIAGGIIAITSLFISAHNLLTLGAIILVPALFVPVFYSWWLWRHVQSEQSK